MNRAYCKFSKCTIRSSVLLNEMFSKTEDLIVHFVLALCLQLLLSRFIVEWLQRLGYGAEGRRKVVSSRLGFAIQRLENSLCQPSRK